MQFIRTRGAGYEGIKVFKTMYQSRPGPLSNLTSMLRHKMAAILEVGDFRILFALLLFVRSRFGQSPELSTHSFIRLGQEIGVLLMEPHVQPQKL